MSRVISLAKKSIASCCQSSDGWMSVKTGKWSVGEGRRHSVTTHKALFKTLYINQVRALQKQTRSGRRHSVTTHKALFKTLYINQVRALQKQTRSNTRLLNRQK